jgi:hypothetical protein
VRGAGAARTGGAICASFAALVAIAVTRPARGETPPGHAVLDRAIIRFYAPETGGTAHPSFIDERTLAFEARLEALAEGADQGGPGYQERHVRAALEHHLGEELLESLAHKLIEGSPSAKRPGEVELAHVAEGLGAAWFERLGGRARVDAAASAEGLDATEVGAILQRQTLAAWYIDRAISPVLRPSEEQLRDVFRTSEHPYSGRPFDEVRASLERWFVLERVRVAEGAFFQATRSHVVVVVTR